MIKADISIIIPVYNLEKYIGVTLESVIAQQGITMEVLVVDDHSTDSSRTIVEAYCAKFPYITLLTNERTKGVSGARNTALNHMTGKTFFLLDGDDILPKNALAPLFTYLQDHDVPLVKGQYSFFCTQRWVLFAINSLHEEDKQSYPRGHICLYLYDSSLVKNKDIYFPEDCTVGEDHTFFCQILCSLSLPLPFPCLSHQVYTYRNNHKTFSPTGKTALSFITYLTHMRTILEHGHKMHLFSSCMAYQFTEHWLRYAYCAQQESKETLQEYLHKCAHLFAGKEDVFAPLLQPTLQHAWNDFWQASQKYDTKVMLAILQKLNALQPFSESYIGIAPKQTESPYWAMHRILHRAKNLFLSPHNARDMMYMYRLQRKSHKLVQFYKKNKHETLKQQ